MGANKKIFWIIGVAALAAAVIVTVFKTSLSHKKAHSSVTQTNSGVTKSSDSGLKPGKITIADTLIGNDKVTINWFESGRLEVHKNNFSDTIHWFSYGDFAAGRNHASLLVPFAARPQKIVLTKKLLLFSVIDFKGRAAMFRLNIFKDGSIKFASAAAPCINPVIRECPYIYVDVKNNRIVNNGGYQTLQEGAASDTLFVYEYDISTECTKEKATRIMSKQKTGKKSLDMYNLADAVYFYSAYLPKSGM